MASDYYGIFTVIDISDLDSIEYPSDLQGTEFLASGIVYDYNLSFADFGEGKVVLAV